MGRFRAGDAVYAVWQGGSVCVCGNVFKQDACFCDKCGAKRKLPATISYGPHCDGTFDLDCSTSGAGQFQRVAASLLEHAIPWRNLRADVEAHRKHGTMTQPFVGTLYVERPGKQDVTAEQSNVEAGITMPNYASTDQGEGSIGQGGNSSGSKGSVEPGYFPYHDPAYGSHFRQIKPFDHWDTQLLGVEPDEPPPLQLFMRDTLKKLQEKEENKRLRREVARMEHEVLKKLHLESLQDSYNEVRMPPAFQHHAFEPHPALVTISPEPEYRGLTWWLA